MREYIIFWASGSNMGRMPVKAKSKNDAGEIFRREHAGLTCEGILSVREYEKII